MKRMSLFVNLYFVSILVYSVSIANAAAIFEAEGKMSSVSLTQKAQAVYEDNIKLIEPCYQRAARVQIKKLVRSAFMDTYNDIMNPIHSVYGNPDGQEIVCCGLKVLFCLLNDHQFYKAKLRYEKYENNIKPYLLKKLGNLVSVRSHWNAVKVRCDVMHAIARLDSSEYNQFHINLSMLGVSDKCSFIDCFLIETLSDADVILKRSCASVCQKLLEWKPYWNNSYTTQKDLQNIIHFINFLRDADYQSVKDKLFGLTIASMDVFDVMNISNFIARLPRTPTRNAHMQLVLDMLTFLDESPIKGAMAVIFGAPFDVLRRIDCSLHPLTIYKKCKRKVLNFTLSKMVMCTSEYDFSLLECEVADITEQSMRILATHGDSDVDGKLNACLVKAVCHILPPKYAFGMRAPCADRRRNVIDAALPYMRSTMTAYQKSDVIIRFSMIPDVQLPTIRQMIDDYERIKNPNDHSLVHYIRDLAVGGKFKKGKKFNE